MSTVFMMIGLPYSGKTTFVENNSLLNKLRRLSTDETVHALASADGSSYNKDFKKYYKKAKAMMLDEINRLIEEQVSFVLDRTNLTKKSRAQWIKMFTDKGYKVIAVSFNHPLQYSEIVDRVKNRPNQVVSKKVYNGMMKMFEKPTISEGFAEIIDL